jgi:hypothetical protein
VRNPNLVNQRRPLVLLDEPLAVFAAISFLTISYNTLNAVGSVSYLASNLCQGIIVTFRYTHALIDQQWKRKIKSKSYIEDYEKLSANL